MDLIAAIEKTRRDLLELGARNRLVHTPLEGKRKSWIEVDDERTEQIFDLLVRQRKTLSFLPREAHSDEDDRDEFMRVFDGDGNGAEGELDFEETLEEGPDAEPAEHHTDLFLQTRLAKENLHDRLLKMFYEARTAEEEQGVSILFLACGFLRWRESPSSSVNRYAPLLLIPVELSRNTARSKFRLDFRDDEIVTNLSIQARLQQDFGIRLPDLPEGLQDDDEWSPTNYFDAIRELIEDRDGWEVVDNEILVWFFSFTKFLMFRDLSPDAWPEEASLKDNPLVRSLLGDGFGAESGLPPTVPDDGPIDEALNPADVIHVTDADSSQAIVVEEVAQGRNLVVQGPPGTGKSQTITNAIAAAVHAGKRVLFISEKMAALEVVKRRLDQYGLGPMTLELHSHKSRKREVLEELKATIEAGVPTGTQAVSTEELRRTAQRLRQHGMLLHSPIGNSECSPYQAMGRLMRLKSTGRITLRYSVPEITQWTPEEFEAQRLVAVEVDRLLDTSGSPASNVWRGARCAPLTPSDLDRLMSKLAEVRDRLNQLDEATADLANVLGLPEPADLLGTSQLAQLAAHLKRCPPRTDRNALGHPGWDGGVDAAESAVTTAQQIAEARASIGTEVCDAVWEMDLSSTRVALAAHGRSWLRVFNSSFRQAVATLRGICEAMPPKDPESRVRLVDTIIQIQEGRQHLSQHDETVSRLLGRLWAGEATPTSDAVAVINWVKRGAQSELGRQHLRPIAAGLDDFTRIDVPLKRIGEQLKTADAELAGIVDALKLDCDTAFEQADPRRVPLVEWYDRIGGWLDQREQLSHYLATHTRISQLRKSGLRDLAEEVETGEIGPGEVAERLELIRSEAILNQAWRERPELASFHGETYEEWRSRFAELDRQRIVLSRLEVAKAHHGKLPSRSADGGQVSIVQREINKKRRHKPIRRLLREAGHAIQKIKPVFMMSPLSVAQFLEPGVVEFDLLVIDEASQVEPVDALGAVARCKQIVVVGDQKQLPPTNFFGRISGETDEDDDSEEAASAGDVESILGLCEAQGLPNRMLRWHYRSRHESLIAVSNRQFYEDRLFIVPSPLVSGGPLGLKLRYIADGWYDRGGSRTNRNEAIAVADAVVEHARKRPHLSLGVATFSAAQRDAIRDELELRRKENPSMEEFFGMGGAEPFFVKSLENVQGDQRDVIYISIGYARDKDGYFNQNFGPLNRKGGERRLNVLISRAASACEVFTSLKADDIDLARTQSEGVAALKMYLNYAEHGRLDATQSHGDADSIFEEQVALALRNRGLEVDHQIGVGGFYIDLAIRDPQRRGRYLLGIECDGAQYHSARWVRDRDRLRQQILESRGWIIHRIWSTDWFQRPEEQLGRVLEALGDAKKHWEGVDRSEAETATVIAGRISPDDLDGDAFWERVASPEDDQPDDSGKSLYREADFNVQGFAGGPADLNTDQLARLIEKVVGIEAPIHIDEIGRRCITILGKGRLVKSLKHKIAAAVENLENAHVVERRGAFAYRPGEENVPVRSRRTLENANLRKVNFIAPEELRAAIVAVVTEHIGTEEAETISSVAKMLGVSNSKAFQTVVSEQITQLCGESAISERAGKLFAS